MNTKETRRFEMLKRVQEFGLAQRASFAEGSVGARMFTEVGLAVSELGAQAVSREMARGEGVNTKARTRDALVGQMQKVRQTAQVLAFDTPGAGDGFEVPLRRSAEALVTSARTFVRDAEPLAADFIAHGMSDTFLADLTAAADAFEAAQQLRDSGRRTASQARARMREAFGKGVRAARRLDAIVENAVTIDEPTRDAWRQLRRVGPRSDRNEASPPQTRPSTPSPATATTGSTAVAVAAGDTTPAVTKLVA